MKAILLDGTDRQDAIASIVREVYTQKFDELAYFKLSDMDVKSCISCGSCSYKTPGECAVKDDIAVIFPELVDSDVVIVLSPIRFGGFSSHLKKVVDKFMLLGLPLYTVKKGHMVHPSRYGTKKLIAIGIKECEVGGQIDGFKTLVANNALNLNYTYQTIIINSIEGEKELISVLESEATS